VLLDGSNILIPARNLNLLRARVGMVFQKPTPFPMSIYENIAFGVRLFENPVACGIDERVQSALRRARDLGRGQGQAARERLSLSGGQQQRLCIARTVGIEA